MRRNAIYRKRHIVGTVMEFVLPFCFVWIMVAIKNSVDLDEVRPSLEYLPHDNQVVTPFTFEDYMVALQAQRVCEILLDYPLTFQISGIHDLSFNWQVPFVRCDSRKCTEMGQDAQPFCEYKILAVSGSYDGDSGGLQRAEIFQDYVYTRWPFLLTVRNGKDNPGRPFPFEFVQIFRDPSAMDAYIRRNDYGTPNVPKIGIGIVFDGDNDTHYKYWLRQNSTNLNAPESEVDSVPVLQTTAPTDTLFNDFARNDYETCFTWQGDPNFGVGQASCTGRYFYNGVLATQRLVGDFILNQSGAEENGYFVADAGVQYVQFPQNAFLLGGFFQQFNGEFVLSGWLNIGLSRLCRQWNAGLFSLRLLPPPTFSWQISFQSYLHLVCFIPWLR